MSAGRGPSCTWIWHRGALRARAAPAAKLRSALPRCSAEDAAFRLACMPEAKKRRLRREARRAGRQAAREAEERARQADSQAEERRLEEAKAFLRAAGLSIPEEPSAGTSSSSATEGEGRRRRRRSKRRKKRKRRG